jgi:hypothetical protein
MAQYAILIYAHDSAHAPDATSADLEPCDDHSDELAASGSMLAAYALTPRDMATSVRADAITDGPFLDSKEVVAGFYVVEAPRSRRGAGHCSPQPRRARRRRRRGAAGAQQLPEISRFVKPGPS